MKNYNFSNLFNPRRRCLKEDGAQLSSTKNCLLTQHFDNLSAKIVFEATKRKQNGHFCQKSLTWIL